MRNSAMAYTKAMSEKKRSNPDTSAYEKAKRLKIDPEINQTLYIKNLNDKINPEVIKVNLYLLFSIHGDIIDIIFKPKSKKMRGQAHVVFSNIEEAQKAHKAVQGFKFFDKEIKVLFAQKKSKLIKRIELLDNDDYDN